MDQKEQRLPNECLLLVIQSFALDLRTLHKLLLVNRFFLHAVVPLMLDDPIQAWDMLDKGPKVPSAEKMMGLIFASVVSHNRGLQTTSGSDLAETTRRLTADFLAPFNLQVADVICVPIVKHIMADPCNKTTIDYSRHFKHLGTFIWGENVYSRFVQLLNPPLQALSPAQQRSLFSMFGAVDDFSRRDDSDENESDDSDDEGEDFVSQDDDEGDEEDRDQDQRHFGRAMGRRYSNASMLWVVNFGLRFSVGLRAGPASAQVGFGGDDSVDEDEIDSTPLGNMFGSENAIKTIGIESSARYFQEFGAHGPAKVDDSHSCDMSDDVDGQDLVQKAVRKLGKSTYKKWGRTITQQSLAGYRKVICQCFIDLLLRYNADVVLDIQFDLKDTRHYLASASKLPRLNMVFVMRDRAVRPQLLETAKNFFRDHQKAFPEKRNLELLFGPGWDFFDHHWSGSVEVQSRSLVEFEQQKMELYKAVHYPHTMVTGDIQGFYESCADIDLSRLKGFRDDDDNRFSSGKGPAQEQFLRQCSSLRWMSLNVDSPLQLSWLLPSTSSPGIRSARAATSAVTNLGQLHRPLATLDRLCLISNHGSSILLHVANTVIPTFYRSTCLRDLRLHGKYEKAREDKGSEGLIMSTTIGGWNLPALQSLEFDVQDLDDFVIKSWDQCPLLERLRIGSSPPLVESPRVGKPLQLTIYEPWNLPQLQLLQLSNMPALLFNYESLKTMPSLKVLSLTALDGVTVPSYKAELWRCVAQIPRLSAYLPHKLKNQDATSISQDKWALDWHLPKLTTLVMRGPPAMSFSMDWLKRCPVLHKVALKIEHGYWQPMPLHTDNPAEWVTSPEVSRLREFALQGKWAMREDDITTFLAHYAPNLVKLEVDWIHRNMMASAGALMKVIDEADKIILERAQRTHVRPIRVNLFAPEPEVHHRKLIHVVAKYRLAPRELYSWKTMEVEAEDIPNLQKHHVRVYEFADETIISGRTHHREVVALVNKPQFDMMGIFGSY
ncbi:hypothetical protein BG003_002549 [Podila horticola]|nr:hypothetical protein BG003_002549 [Podila horticola]